jgi:hypothetical protein
MKSARSHADHAVVNAIERQRSAERLAIARKSISPQLIADDRHRRAARLVLLRCEVAAKRELRAQGAEEARGYLLAVDVLGRTRSGQIASLIVERAHLLERAGVALPVAEVEVGNPDVPAAVEIRLPDHAQPVRLGVGEGREQYAVHHAEDGRIGADTEREREHSDQRKPGTAPQLANSVANVLPERLEPSRSLHFAAPFRAALPTSWLRPSRRPLRRH